MRRSLLSALALSLCLAPPALAGPPWISLEYPVNPYGTATRNAFCLVRVYHHGDAADYPVTGTAEGLVNGTRQTVALTLTPTGTPGQYAVSYQPRAEGTWMLFLRVGGGEHGSATLVVRLNQNGQVISAGVPTHRRDQWDIPDQVTSADIERLLHQQPVPASAPSRPLRNWTGSSSLAR
jgi:hypothetical protein